MSILRPLIKRKKSQREEPIDTPYTTGLIQDPPDDRDLQLSNIKEVSGVKNAPQKVDYSSEMSNVKNQGKAGTCVSFAVAAVREGQEKMEYLKERKEGSNYKRESKEYDLSESGIYWNCKKIDSFPDSEGTTIRAGMKVLNKIGVPQEKAWPYTDDLDNPGKPKPGSKLTARWKKIKSYHRINKIDELIDYIANHGPVIAGVLVYRGFYYPENDGTVPMPGSNEKPLGAHAVCCHPETSITTDSFIKKINDIEDDDQVLTRDGYKRVTNTSKRYIDEEIYNIYSNLSVNPLKVTKEHPVLAKKCAPRTKISLLDMDNLEFIEAENLKKGYFVKTSIDDKVIENDISEELAGILGYYIGDGNLRISHSKNGNVKRIALRFSYHRKNDAKNIKKLINYVKSYDNNINFGIYRDKKTKTNCITFYSTEFGKEILNLCGGAHNKNLSEKILYMEKEKQMKFVEGGGSSDGCSKGLDKSSIFTSEENLAEQLVFILQRNRLVYNVKTRGKCKIKFGGKEYNCKGGYDISFHDKYKGSKIYYRGNSVYSRISDVIKEHYSGYVYNFEVEDKHEYIANNIITHNCLCGYDKNTEKIMFKNSGGSNGGNSGFGMIHFKFWENHSLDTGAATDIDVKKETLEGMWEGMKK